MIDTFFKDVSSFPEIYLLILPLISIELLPTFPFREHLQEFKILPNIFFIFQVCFPIIHQGMLPEKCQENLSDHFGEKSAMNI